MSPRSKGRVEPWLAAFCDNGQDRAGIPFPRHPVRHARTPGITLDLAHSQGWRASSVLPGGAYDRPDRAGRQEQ